MATNPMKETLKGQIIQTVEGDRLTPNRFETAWRWRSPKGRMRPASQNPAQVKPDTASGACSHAY